MASAFIRFEDDCPSHESKCYILNKVKSPQTTSYELDPMPVGLGASYQGPTPSRPASVHHQRTCDDGIKEEASAVTPNQLESSRPPSPAIQEVAEVVQSIWSPYMNRWRVLGACLAIFSNGCNDSAPGALLPYMETYYNVKYALVSLIFIGNAAGFILAAFFVHALDSRLGRARTLMFCDLVSIAGYIMIATAPPFAVFIVGFCFTGFGIGTQLALFNVFCANLANSTVILGLLHGSYGIGGVFAPIAATLMASHRILFSRFYIILLGFRALSFFFNGWAYRCFERDAQQPSTLLSPLSSSLEVSAEPSKFRQFLTALKSRTTIVGALFIFAYQGAEVSISGWVISFLIKYRGGDPAKIGYVTAGFWGGIAIGRFILSYATAWIGEKLSAYGLIVGAMGFQILVWRVPNTIGDSVAVAIVGLLLGPIYPAATTIFSRLVPRRMQNTALAFISSAGSSGGAIAPFATGVIAQKFGIWVMHPICVGLFGAMIVCWAGLPRLKKRKV